MPSSQLSTSTNIVGFYHRFFSGLKTLEMQLTALAGVAEWIECQPVNQRVTGLIPSQGTCLGCGPGPQLGVYNRQPHVNVSLPLFLPPFPSL